MSKIRIDELNTINLEDDVETLSEEAVREIFRTYYEPMEVSDEQKKQRVDMAYDLYLLFYMILTAIKADYATDEEVNLDLYSSLLSTKLYNEVFSNTNNLGSSEVIAAYIPMLCSQIVETTMNHIDSDYYTSQNRGINIAKTEANVFLNADDYEGISGEGYTYKIWCTQGDARVRDIHKVMEGTRVPINEYFVLDNGDMLLYPCDVSMNPSDESIANCRCSLDYE